MRDIDELIINKVVICVLDKNQKEPILPEKEIELTEISYEYFEKHLLRCFANEDARPARFYEGPNLLREIMEEIIWKPAMFLPNCEKIARLMFKAIANEEKEPSGDLAVIEFECRKGKFIGVMKLNFSENYCHVLKGEGDKISIELEQSMRVLPGAGQKVDHIMVYGSEDKIFVYDRDIDGWFIRGFGRMIPGRDDRTNLKAVRKAVEIFARKAYEENPSEAESFRRKVGERLRTEDIFDVQGVAAMCIEDPEKQEIFSQTIQAAGIEENEIKIDHEWAERQMSRRKFLLDKGVALLVENEIFRDKAKFQVNPNGDGTVNIQILGIRSFTEK